MLVVETWDGNNINDGSDYRAGFTQGALWGLPDVVVKSIGRTGNWPVFGGLERGDVEITLFISIEDESNIRSLRAQLFRWFDPDDEDPKQLVVTDDGTSNERYIEAVCSELRPIIINGIAARDGFRVKLIVSGDSKWRSTTETSSTWNITASGDTTTENNQGETDAFPIFEVKPTTAKTGGYEYRRWVPVVWKASNSANSYPVRGVLDTDALVTAGKMQSDGDDLRVTVDGQQVNRWLNDIDTASTDIWWEMDFARAPDLELKTAIAGAGAITEIEFEDEVEVALLPDSGIILIEDEAFVYTGRNLLEAKVTGITREAKGTTAAAHSAGTTCHWVQHDVYILYGNASAIAPGLVPEPAFELDTSTNDQWDYSNFGGEVNASAAWQGWGPISSVSYKTGGRYTDNHGSYVAPDTEWPEIGAFIGQSTEVYGWYLENPCGIVNAEWTSGEKYCDDKDEYSMRLRYWIRDEDWWTDQLHISSCTADDTWENWSESFEGSDWDAADVVAMILYFYSGKVEVSSVSVKLNTSETPDVTINSEESVYEIDATLENETTGDKMYIAMVLDLNTTLEIDTYNKTVTWLEDDSRQNQAVTFDSVRRDWLKLQQGNNTLKYTDTGTGDVTITIKYRKRYY